MVCINNSGQKQWCFAHFTGYHVPQLAGLIIFLLLFQFGRFHLTLMLPPDSFLRIDKGSRRKTRCAFRLLMNMI